MQLNQLMLMLALPLAAGFGLGMTACADPDPSCTVGSFGCSCYPGNICLAGLTCLSNICLQFAGEGETTGDPGDGDGDTGPGDGDGDTGPGDGDTGPGDGDGDAGDGDGDTGPGDGDGDSDPCAGAPILLHSQGADDEIYSGLFANTLTDFSGSSVELADDFVVPQNEGCWCITEIVARGFYNDGILPANTPNVIVEVFNDGNSVPTGSPIASDTALPSDDMAGVFTVPLTDFVVPAGTHWLSVRPELEFAETYWFWAQATSLTGDTLAARDPDAIIFMGMCTVWTPASACFPNDPPDGYQFEVQFDIIGTIGGDACN